MPYCTNCGEEVSPDARFCTNCGADMSTEETAQSGGGAEPPTAGEGGGQGQQPGQPAGGQGGAAHGAAGQGPAGQGAGHQQPGAGRGQPAPQHGGRGGQLSQETSGGLDFAIGYPKRNGWTATIISTAMVFLSFLIVPFFILVGYGFRVARAAALGRPNPPEYDDWGGLIVDGLRFTVVSVVFTVAVYLVIFVGLAVAGAADSAILVLFLIPLYFAVVYALPAFQTAFVGSNSITGAFTDGRAISLLQSGYYAKSFLMYIALNIVLSIVATFALITIVGFFVVYAYMVLAFGAFWGLVYYRAAQRGIVPPPVEDQQPTHGQPQQGQAPPRQPR